GTFLQVLKRDKPLDRLEPEEKKRVLGDSYKVVDSFMKGDISKLDPQSQNTLGSAVATLMQGFDEAQGNTENTRRALPVLTNPNFIGFINNFDGSGDGAVKKEILADSALTVLQKYITKPTDGAVARLNELSQRMKAGAAGQEGIASSGGVAGSLVSGQPVSSLLTYNRDTGLIQ